MLAIPWSATGVGHFDPRRSKYSIMEERFEKGRVYKLAWVRQKDGMMVGESPSRRMEETRTKEERFQKEKVAVI